MLTHSCNDANLGPNSTLGYYDGNTVTALWNYAQHFAMSDDSFGTSFGPSTPGLLNLVAGTTFEGTITNGLSADGNIAGGATHRRGPIGDPDPGGRRVLQSHVAPRSPCRARTSATCSTSQGITWGYVHGRLRPNCTNGTRPVSPASAPPTTFPTIAFFQYCGIDGEPQSREPTNLESA